MFYTTFAVKYRLKCNTQSMETNGFDHTVRGGKYILRSIIYILSTFLHTHADISPVGSPSSKPATVHTSSIYALHSTDGYVVVHLAVSTLSGSCRAIGFQKAFH